MRTLLALVIALSIPAAATPALAEQEPLPPPPIVISAPRTDVWAALTTAEGIVARSCGQAVVDLRPGGAIRRHSDPRAQADAAGWTSTAVLAFVCPRLLVIGEDTPSAWTVIELDALDVLRTRVRIEHVGVPEGPKAGTALEGRDRELAASLEARFPKKPDPVVAALTLLVGTWEERSEAEPEVRVRWTVAVEAGDERDRGKAPSVSLERKVGSGEDTERWAFWREAESGRWVGGLVTGARSVAWEISPEPSGAISWSDRWDELGGKSISIEGPPRDEVVSVLTILGCFGTMSRWTRVPETK